MADSKDSYGNIYHRILEIIHGFFTGIKKNIVLLIVCIAVATSLLFVDNYRSSGVYSTSFTVIYEQLVRKIYGDRLVKLDALVQKEDIGKISTLLKLPEDAVKSIVSIKGKNILGEDLEKDLNTDIIPFIVEIHFTDVTYVSEIQKGILYYLETGNGYLKEKNALKRKEIESEINFIDAQLSMLDTLKRQHYKYSKNKGADGKQADLSSAYQFSYSLYKKKQELEAKNAMPTNLKIIDEVIVPMPEGKSTILILVLGFAIGFVVYLTLVYLFIPAYKLKG